MISLIASIVLEIVGFVFLVCALCTYPKDKSKVNLLFVAKAFLLFLASMLCFLAAPIITYTIPLCLISLLGIVTSGGGLMGYFLVLGG